jgi:deoxyadenosine/deoxycytidine kinase
MTADDPAGRGLLIGVVGVCASGKSTLVGKLREQGFQARHIAQEHSYVRDMWKRITNPDVLIYLDASYGVTVARRALDWREADWAEQQRRLAHAREHADLYIQTDLLAPAHVLGQVLAFLEKAG